MSANVAEYYGQRTDAPTPIEPIKIPRKANGKVNWDAPDQIPVCPFSEGNACKKLKSGYEPVCSVRNNDGTLWLSCSERLCSTKKDYPLCEHQTEILATIARYIFDTNLSKDEICVKREVSLNVVEGKAYHADYIMTTKSGHSSSSGPDRLVLEMQGGGETSDTGKLTDKVKEWKDSPTRYNYMLMENSSASPLVTNAWRRQQEQFLIKGNIAMKTWKGLGIAFCVGTLLYDYLMERLASANLPDLKDYNWTLALIAIKEDKSEEIKNGPIPLTVDEDRILYTNYQTFVQALINQGEPSLAAFEGEFTNLENDIVIVPF